MIGATVLLLVFVKKEKIIDAHISFLFMQSQTWLYGILVSQFQLIIYPVRLVDKGYLSNFGFEYVVFPTIAVLYNLYFPKAKGILTKLFYIFLYPTIITVLEVWTSKTTDLIEYTNWAWYWSWLTMLVTLNITFFYYKWFMRKVRRE
jgi:hypothetical protein